MTKRRKNENKRAEVKQLQTHRRNIHLIENKLPRLLFFHLLENRQATLL